MALLAKIVTGAFFLPEVLQIVPYMYTEVCTSFLCNYTLGQLVTNKTYLQTVSSKGDFFARGWNWPQVAANFVLIFN